MPRSSAGSTESLEPDEPGEQVVTGGQLREQVVAELLLHGAVGEAGRAQGAEGRGEIGHATRVVPLRG